MVSFQFSVIGHQFLLNADIEMLVIKLVPLSVIASY